MVTETDLALPDGRTLHVYDAGPAGGDEVALFWHHGSPNTGAPPGPLLEAAAARGLRWVSHDRPAYGGSTALAARTIASVADDVAAVADALGLDTFAVMGHSGGGAHALACAAALPERVRAAVSVSGLAPFGADGLDWFAGMTPSGAAELRAATEGRDQLQRLLESSDFDPEQFTPADHAALEGEWRWLITVVQQALSGGLDGMLDDDMAAVSPWGCDLARAGAPVLLLHGEQDRMVPSGHSAWLAGQLPRAELCLRPDEGHISVLRHGVAALDWLVEQTGQR